jgi:hypothetical protein
LVAVALVAIFSTVACGPNTVTVSSPSPSTPAAPATATSRPAPTYQDRVEGAITSIDTGAQTFVVSGRTVMVLSTTRIRGWSGALTFANLKVGENVRVIGTTSGTVLTATEILVDDGTRQTPANGTRVSGAVSGLSGTCPALSFKAGGTAVTTSQATKFGEGGCAEVANGVNARVNGVAQTDGSIQATHVFVDKGDK